MRVKNLLPLFLFSLIQLLPGTTRAAAPANGWVVWESNRADSRNEIYRAKADGTEVTRLTKTGGSRPGWSPDGRWIYYFDEAGEVYLMRPDGSGRYTLTNGWPISWMHDNSGFLVAETKGFFLHDPEAKTKKLLFTMDEFPQFAGTDTGVNGITHDGRYLVLGSHLYINGYTGANGSFTSEYSALIVDLLHKDKTYFLGSGCWPFTPPAGDLVFHICADCPTHPDIYRMSLNDLATRKSYSAEVAHEDSDWGHEYNPRVSTDNKYLVYMSSAGCHQGADCDYDIWLHELGAGPGERTRVTQNSAFDGYPHMYVGPLWQPTTEPRLLVTPGRVTFHAGADLTPTDQVVSIKNTGGGTLGPATVAVDVTTDWLAVNQTEGQITVGLRKEAALTRGTHCVNLTITVPGAQESPVVVPVTLKADDSFPVGDAGAPDASVYVGPTVDAGGAPDCDALNGSSPGPGELLADGGTQGSAKDDAGCGCDLGARRHTPTWPLLALVGLIAIRRRR